MFKFFRKKAVCEIYSPVKGKMIPLEKVKDKVFACGLMGSGVGFEFEGDTICSPCNGTIMMIANTKHAIGIKSTNETEVLLHVGMDTVNLNGEGFDILVKENQKVKTNQPIMKINRPFMEEKNIDLTMPMIITNCNSYDVVIKEVKEVELTNIVIETKAI